MISSMELREADTTLSEQPTTEAIVLQLIEETRECSSITLPLCSHLPYNTTGYPNLVNHISKDALLRDLVAFRELLDAECSHLAQVCCFCQSLNSKKTSILYDFFLGRGFLSDLPLPNTRSF